MITIICYQKNMYQRIYGLPMMRYRIGFIKKGSSAVTYLVPEWNACMSNRVHHSSWSAREAWRLLLMVTVEAVTVLTCSKGKVLYWSGGRGTEPWTWDIGTVATNSEHQELWEVATLVYNDSTMYTPTNIQFILGLEPNLFFFFPFFGDPPRKDKGG